MGLYEEGFTQNRELSWLTYNERVLEEAMDPSVPLLERLNYISIFTSNLEEFIQVRIGGLILDDEEDDTIDIRSGLTPSEQIDAVYSRIHKLLAKKDAIQASIESQMKAVGLVRVAPDDLTDYEKTAMTKLFDKVLVKSCKYHIIAERKDFPMLDQDKSYIFARLNTELNSQFALVDVNSKIPRIVVLQDGLKKGSSFRYILTEDVIKMNLSSLFMPFEPVEMHTIDIARTAEVGMDTDSDNLLEEMKKLSKLRKYSSPDKLIADGNMSQETREFLMWIFNLSEAQMMTTSMINYKYISELEEKIPEHLRKSLCYETYHGLNQLEIGNGSMIDRLKRKELLLCYPYDTMDPFLTLLKEAAVDDRVREIRITIYRLSSQPKIVEYLELAAKNGKKVTAVIELRARFDEQNNINWSERLKQNGVNVSYGNKNYKIHSKLCQFVLYEDNRKRYITHISTGNFNEKTASRYTDIAFITYDQKIGIAADMMWQDIMNNEVGIYDHILTSPVTMKKTVIDMIEREMNKGSKGRIFIKVNSVTDEDIIEALMYASCAGCKIKMIVRGICCIIPGIEGCTENIEIVNVVGRFLEHSRVYIFGEGDDEVLFISSADFMNRNMNKRIELACPIYSYELRNRIRAIMYLNYMDNVKGRRIGNDGKYYKKTDFKHIVDSQSLLMNSLKII